jgi:hypothetical protein
MPGAEERPDGRDFMIKAARAAGATITPTEPQLAAEPLPAGPKPVNPVNPSTPL